MVQEISTQAWQADVRTQETRNLIRDIRRVTRRKFTPEEKIRIVLEGFRRDTPIRDLCRREGIRPATYYAWLKDFMEAGRERLQRDTVRDATKVEVGELKRECAQLKQLVAELSLQAIRQVPGTGRYKAHLGLALSPSDQREDREVPPDSQRGHQSPTL